MASFSEFRVSCFDPDFMTLQWAVDGIATGVTFTIDISRSGSKDGPFEPISIGLTNRDTYHDWNINPHSINRMFYYMLTYHGSDGEVLNSDVEYSHNEPDAEAVDIERRISLLLELYTGHPVFFYIRRDWGPKCPKCYDPVQQKTTMSKCDVCYGTGVAGGYFDPILGYVTTYQISRNLRFMQLLEKEDRTQVYWTGNYPLLKARDVFVDNMNMRWEIKNIDVTQKMGSPLRQTFSAVPLPKSNVLYGMDVPSFGEFVPRRDYHVWIQHDPVLPT